MWSCLVRMSHFILCVICFFCQNTNTGLKKIILRSWIWLRFFTFWFWSLTGVRVRFFVSWIVNININVIILHNHYFLIKAACARESPIPFKHCILPIVLWYSPYFLLWHPFRIFQTLGLRKKPWLLREFLFKAK